jgi:gluconokinase
MVILIMGVSGSGKTTIGQMLAAQLNWQFQDADDLHSPANIEQMRRGIPLTDADRRPWLRSLRAEIERAIDTHTNLILACSALKAEYRQDLGIGADRVEFVYLKGAIELIQQRLKQRTGHFMNPDLLQSQFADLQEPDDAIVIEIDLSPAEIVQQIATELALAS